MVDEIKNNINNASDVKSNGNNPNDDVTYFAQTNFRNERRSFGIKRNDRTKHMYIVGKTGMGKTTVLENMAIQDIQRGEGIGIVDPHGSFAEKMLDFIPENRIKDVIYFCPHDTDWPMAFNVMEDVGVEQRHLVASGLMGVFKKLWPDVWSARMEYILNNCILALLEYPDSTLLGINRLLADKDYRKAVVSKVTDPVVKAFWEQEFAKYTERFAAEATPAIQNKVGQFTANPLIRNIIGQPKSSFDIRKIMDEKKIFIMNLSKGRIGESNSQLIGAMLITKLYLAAMSRVNVPESERPDFYLYVDEFQNFATESFKDILSEARKYRLCLILAHQYITQMDEKVRDAVFGNVGTFIVFRVGAYDAEVLEQEFAPEFTAQDIVNLGFANVYMKLMINGVASRPFSALTLPPIPFPEKSYKEEIIEFSRKQYATPKEEVEKRISEWHAPVVKPASTTAEGTGGAPSPQIFEKTKEPTEMAEKPTVQLFDAICSSCGAKTQVPFKPDGKRPVYCKDCKIKYLNKETASPNPPRRIPPSPFRSQPFKSGGVPSFEEGEIVQRNAVPEKRISLEELKKNAPEKKQKPGPDLGSLRKVLEETLDQAVKGPVKKTEQKVEKIEEEAKTAEQEIQSENINGNKRILKPGESIRF
jgi:CxxC-x17-CxxC domain-containing protein